MTAGAGARARMRERFRALAHDDAGSILPLICFFCALGLVVVLLVASATSLYLERKRLLTLADGAALAGAEAFALDEITVDAGVARIALDDADVRAAVEGYLAAAPTHGFEALDLERAASDDGRSATVTVSSMWRPPVLTLFVPEGLRIEATAVSRTVFG